MSISYSPSIPFSVQSQNSPKKNISIASVCIQAENKLKDYSRKKVGNKEKKIKYNDINVLALTKIYNS
jgi:hypothetical protein